MLQETATSYMLELSSNSQLPKWNEVNLWKWKSNIKFRKSACDIEETGEILCRFFNFYFHGVVEHGDTISTILADVIANASTRENNIWSNEVFSDSPSFALNLSSNSNLLEDAVKPVDNSTFSNLNQTPATKAVYKESITDFTIDDGEKFKEFIAVKIDIITLSDEENQDARLLKRLASFLALTLWRAATNNKYQLNNAFFEKQYRSDLNTVAGWSKQLPFYPPCSQCIEACVEKLPNSLPTKQMFVLLVSEYVNCIKTQFYSNKAKFLHKSVLMHTDKHGLGILKLLERASIVIGLKWNKLLEMTYLNLTADSWKTIKQFLDVYLCKKTPQYGYNWARIINKDYLTGYTPEEHLPLAGILLGIVEQVQNVEMWDAEWIEKHKEKLHEMRLYGKVLYDMIKPKLCNLSAFGESARVLKRAREVLAIHEEKELKKKQCCVTTMSLHIT